MAKTLSEYITEVRDIVNDPNSSFYSNTQITRWVNEGRNKTAMQGQCVRIMPAPTARVTNINITAPGVAYADATITISGPDAVDGTPTTATATPVISSGQIVSATVANPGGGYVATPTVTITSNTGAGATAVAVLSPHVFTIARQEIYSFSDFNAVIQATVPGAKGIIGLLNCSVSWGNMRPTLQHWDFSSMQAYLRAGSIGMQNFPQAWAQYGQGSAGTLYFWPVPAQLAQLELDTYCDVLDLSDAQPVDLLPEQFDNAPQWWAAYRAYTNAQRFQDAAQMLQTFQQRLAEARAGSAPPMIPSFYPSY